MRPRTTVTSMALAVAFLLRGPQSTIGAPSDGDHYSVTSSTQVPKVDGSDCGFNDVGAANMGLFRRENRHHEEFRDGRRVRSWDDVVDVFLGCYEP